MTPTIGRIVHYTLSDLDVQRINEQRDMRESRQRNFNVSSFGEIVPLIVVRVWADEYGPGIPGVNGQAFLDGADSLWVTSAKEGTGAGEWSWPAMQPVVMGAGSDAKIPPMPEILPGAGTPLTEETPIGVPTEISARAANKDEEGED